MKDKTQKLPTVADIARLSGTNRSTVSRILNNKKGFSASEKCRLRVLEIAKRLKYHPKSSARSLATNKSYCIGIILGRAYDLSSPFFIPVISGMTKVFNQSNYKIVLMPVNSEGSIDDEVSKAVRSGGCDGFYVGTGMIGKHAMRELSEHSIPVVTTINALVHADSRIKVSSVIEDVDSAYFEMSSELYRLGHRKIAVVLNRAFVPYLDERLNIFRNMLKKVGLEISDDSVFLFNEKSVLAERHEAKIAAVSVMNHLRKHTAIVAMSDLTAFGVCDALLEAGIEPGREISVTGYNNLEDSPLYPVKEPFLSTIDPLKEEKGKLLAEILLELMSQPDKGVIVRKIQARFIPRHSLCPVKKI